MPAPPIRGQPPSDEQTAMVAEAAKHWREIGNDAPVQALARVEEAAKQLVALNSALATLYFAVFALGNLKDRVTSGLTWLFLLPVGLWLVSLLYATLVFVPRARPGADLDDVSVTAWRALRATYWDTVDRKLHWLHLSHSWLLGSFATIFVLLAVLVFSPAPTSSTPTQQVVIVTPTPRPSHTAHP